MIGGVKSLAYRLAPRLAHTGSTLAYFMQWRSTAPAAAYAHQCKQACSEMAFPRASYRRLLELPARFAADVEMLAYGGKNAILRRCRPIRIADAWRISPTHGRGLLVAFSNLACFYYGLACCRGRLDRVLVVVKEVEVGNSFIIGRLSRLAKLNVELTSLDRRGFLKIARTLAAGGVVVTMMDTYVRGFGDDDICHLMGRPVLYNTSLYMLASRVGAGILPAGTVRKGWSFEVVLGQVVESVDKSPTQLAREVFDQLSEQIAANAVQWMVWPNFMWRLVSRHDGVPASFGHLGASFPTKG